MQNLLELEEVKNGPAVNFGADIVSYTCFQVQKLHTTKLFGGLHCNEPTSLGVAIVFQKISTV